MTTFADSCIAKDFHGEPQRFFAGQTVRLRAANCPQNDKASDTVRACFYQNQYSTVGEHGMAVLLNKHTWTYCRELEVL
jgi:hypothetical protein